MIKAVSIIACALNVVLGLVAIVPCLMGAAMGMDSPQAQNDPVAIAICWLFLTFPVVCVVCGLLSLLGLWRAKCALFGLVPALEACLVIGFMLFFGKN